LKGQNIMLVSKLTSTKHPGAFRGMIGKERSLDDTLSTLEKYYIKCLRTYQWSSNQGEKNTSACYSKYKEIMDAGCGQGIFF
jgi:hypothetical protein